jgi:hypothetical protein
MVWRGSANSKNYADGSYVPWMNRDLLGHDDWSCRRG